MLGSNVPGVVTTRRPRRMALDDVQQSSIKFGQPIKIKSGTADSGHTNQTNVLRHGGMFVNETGATGYHVPVSDWVNADHGTVATLTSAEAPDGDWASKVMKLFRNGVQVASVTLGGADDSTSEVVTALNANKAFVANAVASGNDAAVLVITDALGVGALSVEINLLSAYATANGAASSVAHAINVPPDVRVILEEVCMTDASGAAIAGSSTFNAIAGHFKRSELVIGGTVAASLAAVPAWARGAMERLGSKFQDA